MGARRKRKKRRKIKKTKRTRKTKKDRKDDKANELDHRKLFKDGQRNLTPPVADATRAFYESLLEENPDSKIAIKFCVEYGVLPLEQHLKLLHKYNKLKEKGAFSVSAQLKRQLEKKEAKEGKEG